MNQKERDHLKQQLISAIDEAVDRPAPLIEKLRSIAEAARAYAELDSGGPAPDCCLRDAMVSRLRDMNDGILMEEPGSDAWASAKSAYLDCMSFACKVLGVDFCALEDEVLGCETGGAA